MNNAYVNDFEQNNKTYYNELKKYKPLTKIEERKLCKRFKTKNDIIARDKLITSNLKFVVDVAKNYKGHGLAFADLVAEGNMGLLKALDKFDYKKDVKFISYGVWWIKQYIREAINKKKMLPSDELPTDFDKPINDDEIDIKDECINNTFIDNSKKSYDEDEVQIVNDLLQVLNPRECEIIKSYFGLNSDEMTLEEIGQKYKLTKERVRQIKEKALTKLRSNMLLIEDKYLLNRK